MWPRCSAPGIVPEHVVEAAEVRQVRYVLHQRSPAPRTAACGLAALSELRLNLPREVGQRLQQQRRVAARVVDVGLQQDAVARRLVHLDVESVRQQGLELGAVEAGPPADERQPRRVECELVAVPRVEEILPGGERAAVIGDARRPELAGTISAGVVMWK